MSKKSIQKRNYRTPEQIIADTELKLDKLRLRAAKRAAADNPLVAPMVAEKNDLIKQLREATKLMASGPQSAEARIATHMKWVSRINEQLLAAQDLAAELQPQIDAIDARIVQAIEASVQSDALGN